MKRIIALILVVVMGISVAACGAGETEKTKEDTPSFKTLEDGLALMEKDEQDTVDKLTKSYEKIKNNITNYDKYKASKDDFTAWYQEVMDESTAYFTRTQKNCEAYYRLMESRVEHNYEEMDDALDDLYDTVYSGTYDDIYDDVYSGLLEDIYDDYYSGVLEDAYNTANYSEWSDELSEFYREWSDALSDFYRLRSDEGSIFYRTWSDVYSAIYKNDYEKMLEEVQKQQDKREKKESNK